MELQNFTIAGDTYLIDWSAEGNVYSVELDGYLISITEESVNPQKRNYSIVIKDATGQVIGHPISLPPPGDFEQAERWVFLLLSAIDLPEHDPNLVQKRCRSTLDLCRKHLPHNAHSSFASRLANLNKWLQQSQNLPGNSFVQSPREQENINLAWVEEDGVYRANTEFGIATIAETRATTAQFSFGASDFYKAWIEHATGVLLKAPGEFATFENAEDWLTNKLGLLLDPSITESHLDEIRFTLNICKHWLSDSAEFYHYLRLDYIIDELELDLP